MRLILALVLATRFASSGAAQTRDTVAQAPMLRPPIRLNLDAGPGSRPIPLLGCSDSSRATHHLRHALIGAGVGAAVGIVAGLVSSPMPGLLGSSCGNSSGCTSEKAWIITYTLTADGTIGAVVGTFLGALFP